MTKTKKIVKTKAQKDLEKFKALGKKLVDTYGGFFCMGVNENDGSVSVATVANDIMKNKVIHILMDSFHFDPTDAFISNLGTRSERKSF